MYEDSGDEGKQREKVTLRLCEKLTFHNHAQRNGYGVIRKCACVGLREYLPFFIFLFIDFVYS